MIITLVLLGRLLETRARGQTSSAIRKLLDLRPKTAHIVRNGRDVETPIEHIQVGDHIRVRPGENIPVDGLIQNGQSTMTNPCSQVKPYPLTNNKATKS